MGLGGFLKGLFSSSERGRQDPAAFDIKNDPLLFTPTFKVSEEPICPYCGESLGKRKTPSRRSKFSCKKCGNVVYADPWHHIFPSIYLNVKQALIACYLGLLNKSPATAGSTQEFWWAAQQKDWTAGKSTLTDAEASDVLWMLMNYNVVHMKEILPKEEKEALPYFTQQLQTWLSDYREEEKSANQEMKEYAKDKKDGNIDAKIDLVCPNCQKNLGKIPRPSKRSMRRCKLCKKNINIEPDQKVFSSIFLTDKQAVLSGVIAQLDAWAGSEERTSAFHEAKKRMEGAESLSDDDIADIMRRILVENIDKAIIEEKEMFEVMKEHYKEMKDIFPDDKPEYDDFGSKRLKGLLKDLNQAFKPK